MPPKKKAKLNESPKIYLIWMNDEVQLLLEIKKKIKVCGNTNFFDSTTSLLFSETYFSFSSSNAKLCLCFSQVANVSGI